LIGLKNFFFKGNPYWKKSSLFPNVYLRLNFLLKRDYNTLEFKLAPNYSLAKFLRAKFLGRDWVSGIKGSSFNGGVFISGKPF